MSRPKPLGSASASPDSFSTTRFHGGRSRLAVGERATATQPISTWAKRTIVAPPRSWLIVSLSSLA